MSGGNGLGAAPDRARGLAVGCLGIGFAAPESPGWTIRWSAWCGVSKLDRALDQRFLAGP